MFEGVSADSRPHKHGLLFWFLLKTKNRKYTEEPLHDIFFCFLRWHTIMDLTL